MTNTDPGPLTRRLHDAELGSLAEESPAITPKTLELDIDPLETFQGESRRRRGCGR